MKKLLSIILLLTLFLVTAPCFAQNSEIKQKTEKIVEVLNSKEKPSIVYFYSKWCHSCRSTTPMIKSLESEFNNKYNFVYINTDKPYSYAFSGHFKVNAVPTLFIHDTKNNQRQRMKVLSLNKSGFTTLLNKYYEKNYSK